LPISDTAGDRNTTKAARSVPDARFNSIRVPGAALAAIPDSTLCTATLPVMVASRAAVRLMPEPVKSRTVKPLTVTSST